MPPTTALRKTPTRSQTRRNSLPQNPVVDRKMYEKLLAAERRKVISIKPVKISIRRKAVALPTEPGSWHGKTAKQRPDLPNALSTTPSGARMRSLVPAMDSRIGLCLPTGNPFEPAAPKIQCKFCKKPLYKPTCMDHIRKCLVKKQAKLQKKKEAREAKGYALRKARNGGVSPEPSGRKGAEDKKRKATDDGDAPTSKRKKKEPKPKTGKLKGPVDVEKQCGVPLPNGLMCARSLTCKSHSMGAKRAVMGRSMRYDVLLAQYQKRNHARQHSECAPLCYSLKANAIQGPPWKTRAAKTF
jgi:SAGA-associated factor 73